MAYEPNSGDPYRSAFSDDEARRAARTDSELQPDPELTEGRASTAKIVILLIAIAIIVGAVLYGLNQPVEQPSGGTSSTAKKTQSAPAPTPPANGNQGTTTGTAPAQPQQPTSSAPSGQEINRSGNPGNSAPKQ